MRDRTTEDFLSEIIDVCKKHNKSISHEDGYGAFIIEGYDDFNIEWLREAYDESI